MHLLIDMMNSEVGIRVGEAGKPAYDFLSHKSMNSLTVPGPCHGVVVMACRLLVLVKSSELYRSSELPMIAKCLAYFQFNLWRSFFKVLFQIGGIVFSS